jgi:hypothetical protein
MLHQASYDCKEEEIVKAYGRLGHLNIILYPPLVPQLGQLFNRLIQGHNLASVLSGLVIAVADVHRLAVTLLGTDNENEVVKL